MSSGSRTCCSSQVPPSRCPTTSHASGSWSVQSGTPSLARRSALSQPSPCLCQPIKFQRARMVTVRNPVSFCLSPYAKWLKPSISPRYDLRINPGNRFSPWTLSPLKSAFALFAGENDMILVLVFAVLVHFHFNGQTHIISGQYSTFIEWMQWGKSNSKLNEPCHFFLCALRTQ